MTPRNPLPPNLSHLAQRDAAIRAEERERAARLCREIANRQPREWLVDHGTDPWPPTAEECAAAILGDAE